MKWILRTFIAVLLPATLLITGCGGSLPKPTDKAPGFLPDYALLTPVKNPPKDAQIYTYVVPGMMRSDYQSVMIDPVIIYQTATTKGVTDQQIEGARADIQAAIGNIVSQQMPVTATAGSGVARLSVAITGAVIDGQSFKVRNLIPVSAAIYLTSKATNLDSKTPAMMVELKFTDSVSGKLLRETVTIIKGDSFRMQSSSSAEFAQLAQAWVKQAMQYSAAQAVSQ